MLRFAIPVIALLILGCHEPKKQAVQLFVEDSIQLHGVIRIVLLQNLDEVVLAEGTLDSVGQYKTTISIEKPTLANIRIGQKYGELYLEPGYNLSLKVQGIAYTDPLQFSGKGTSVNQFINEINATTEASKFANGKGISNLSTTEFNHRIDSIRYLMKEGLAQQGDQNPAILSMLTAKHKVKLAAITQEYLFYKLNSALNASRETIEQNGALPVIDAEVNNLMAKSMLIDTVLMSLNSGDHYMLNNFLWHTQVNLPVTAKVLQTKKFEQRSLLAQEYIIGKHTSPALEEFMLGFDLDYRISLDGITPEIDSAMAVFKKRHPNSSYHKKINANYTSWLALNPGNPAPDFVGITPHGDSVSLKSLRGNLVYVDVWATWCAPCREEIPYAKKLHEKLSHHKNLVFLNVSVDVDREAWKKFLTTDKDWKGLHINVDEQTYELLIREYKMFGVPQYFLIDEQGKILSTKAKRPSAGDMVENVLVSSLKQSH
jgi:thiol-disulfide isomerase/thioredoxin